MSVTGGNQTSNAVELVHGATIWKGRGNEVGLKNREEQDTGEPK